MIKWISLALLLASSTAQAFTPQAQFKALVVRSVGAEFLQNPFIDKCFQTSNTPVVTVPEIQVSLDNETHQKLYTIKFNGADLSPRMILSSGSKVDLEKTSQKNGFVISILRGETEEFSTRIELKNNQGDYVDYDLHVASEGATFQEKLSDAQARRVCIKSQIWVGVGVSTLAYDQKVQGIDASSKFTAITPGSYHIDGRYYFSPEWGIIGSLKSSPGKIKVSSNTPIDSVAFDRKIYEAALQYRNYNFMTRWREHLFYPYLRLGYQMHDVPSIFIDDSGALSLKSFNMNQAAVGVGVNVFNRQSMFYEMYFNMKYPISSTAQSLTPKLHFDGAIGVGKAITQNFNLGLFWHGHYDRFGYSLSQNGFENQGETTILFWNVDLKAGWTF